MLEAEGYFKDNLETGVWNYFYKNKLVLSELYNSGKFQETIYKDVKHFEELKRLRPRSR